MSASTDESGKLRAPIDSNRAAVDDVLSRYGVMKNPPHPGAIIGEDVLSELNLTVAEAATRLGVSRVTLSRVIHGHAGVSPNLAVRLERTGVGTARAWLAMQSNYDLARELASNEHDVSPLVIA